jgi:hypothetical protein
MNCLCILSDLGAMTSIEPKLLLEYASLHTQHHRAYQQVLAISIDNNLSEKCTLKLEILYPLLDVLPSLQNLIAEILAPHPDRSPAFRQQ